MFREWLMAEWGPGIYENDDAMDWIYDLLDSGSLGRVNYALNVIAQDGSGPYETADCRIALVAADIVAALEGEVNPDLPQEVQEWIDLTNRSASELRGKAENVVRQIIVVSELKKHMQQTGQEADWLHMMQALLKRLEF